MTEEAAKVAFPDQGDCDRTILDLERVESAQCRRSTCGVLLQSRSMKWRSRVIWVLPAMGVLAACGSGAATSNPANRAATTTRPTGADSPVGTSTGASDSTTPTSQIPPSAASAPWTASQLTITARSLGAVRVGMTLADAQQAAGVKFDGFGDGFAYPTSPPQGFPHDFVGGTGISPDGVVQCVGTSGTSAAQTVSTPEGLQLGDPVSRVLAIYGARARFVPAPTTGGMTDYSGYLVSGAEGNLAFVISNQQVSEIEGGNGTLGPNSCTG